MAIQPFTSVGTSDKGLSRLRRSCLAVPGSDPKMMARAADTEADEIFLDLEDAVSPALKKDARSMVVDALNEYDYRDKTVVVRVNDATTPFQYEDIITVVAGAGERLDCLMLPKVQNAGQVWFAEYLLNQLEADLRLPRRIGLEIQIETGTGSANMLEIARVTDRIETLIFGPGDYAADQGVPQLDLGMIEHGYPGHQWHYILAQMVNTARAVGCDAIDGPFGDFQDSDGYRTSAIRASLLGIDGKWCIHPSQIPIANEVFTPTADQFAYAKAILEAYDGVIAEGRGAATLNGKMIDEASRKMALKLVARGEAAGLQ